MSKKLTIFEDSIRSKIHTIRGKQVILDEDLAELYEVEVKRLNEQVKRNLDRFPEDFMFELSDIEVLNLRSQIATTRGKHGGRRNLPKAFTEHGVTALSGILRSKKAIEINIKVIRAFIAMRRFLTENAGIFQKLDRLDKRLIDHDEKFSIIFDYMSLNEPKQGIFFDGQVFDAYKFVCSLVKKAKKSIILIDNYIDETVLELFSESNVDVEVFTSNFTKKLQIALRNITPKIDRSGYENSTDAMIGS